MLIVTNEKNEKHQITVDQYIGIYRYEWDQESYWYLYTSEHEKIIIKEINGQNVEHYSEPKLQRLIATNLKT